MRKGWEIKELGEILIIERGGSPRPIQKYLTDDPNGFNWIKISDATSSKKYNFETQEKIKPTRLHKTRQLFDGDFILSNSMSFGRPYIMKTTGCIHDGWLLLRDKEKGRLDKNYLYYILSSPLVFEQFDRLAAGSTVRNLNIGLVSCVKIPVPPISEQKQIVSILDKAFAAIDKAKENLQRNLENAKDYFQNILDSIFDKRPNNWSEKKLSQVFLIKPQKKEAREMLDENDLVSFLPMEDLGIDIKEISPLKKKPLKEVISGYTYFANDDVLLAKITPCFENGKLGVAKILKNNIGFGSSEYIVFRPTGNIISDLLFFFLNRDSFRKKGEKQMGGAVGHKRVAKDFIENYIISFPEIEEQKAIVRKLDLLSIKIKMLEENYGKKNKFLNDLKKSTLQKAFSGQLSESGFAGLEDEHDRSKIKDRKENMNPAG